MYNWLASTTFGAAFHEEEDHIAYVPIVVVGFILTGFGIGAIIGEGILIGLLFFLPVLLAALIALPTTFSAYAKASSNTQSVYLNYLDLTKDERKVLPSGTMDKVFKVDDYRVNDEVKGLIADIVASRYEQERPALDNFLADIKATREAVQMTNDTYKELM